MKNWTMVLLVTGLVMLSVSAWAQGAKCALKFGDLIKDFEAKVSPEGAKVQIEKKDSPFERAVLEIPPKALAGDQTLTFSHAKGVFTDAQGSAHEVMVLSISPFLKTKSGNGYADEVVSFKVPVDPKQPAMVMAFYFDTKNNRPDMVMMSPSADGKYLEMATRHFNDPFFFLGLQ